MDTGFLLNSYDKDGKGIRGREALSWQGFPARVRRACSVPGTAARPDRAAPHPQTAGRELRQGDTQTRQDGLPGSALFLAWTLLDGGGEVFMFGSRPALKPGSIALFTVQL